MRSNGIVSMASALEWNLNHGQRNLRLFEIGRTYELHNGEPLETPVLTIGATGLAREKTIYEAAREYSFADLKGDLDRIGEIAGGLAWKAGSPSWLAGVRAAKISLAHGNGSAESIGHAGQLARRVADEFKLRQEAFVAELRLEPLLERIDTTKASLKFKPLPRYPAVERDFSLIVADGVTFAQVAETIRALEIPEVQSIEAADLFRGGNVPPGKFSLMIRVIFQSAQATLTEAQVMEFSARIVKALQEKLGAVLRAS
jgi:phenylalanyl-tRNA synthetase beta chain